MVARGLACALALIAPLSFGYGCKGGGSGDDGPGEFLLVVQTAPPPDSTENTVAVRIGFQVDAEIDPTTLTENTFFVVSEDGTPVSGTLSVGGDEDDPTVAVLEPDEPLEVITGYTATITTRLVAQGVSLQEDFVWSFRTLDSEWGMDDWIETTNTGTSSEPQVALDAQLNGLAVWTYEEPGGSSIYANRYTRRDTWGEPEPIDGGGGGASAPSLAVDAAGNGFAVWERSDDGFTASIWSNRYTVDEGWGNSELIQTGDVTPASDPVVAADPNGNAIAIWVQRDMENNEQLVWANRYEPGSGWGTAAAIDPNPAGGLLIGNGLRLGMDDDGNAIALWVRPLIDGDVVWANRYTAGSGWGTAEIIKDDETTDVTQQRLTVGPGGDAFLVWRQPGETRADIWSVRFSGTAWEDPVRIDNYDADDKGAPDVGVDGSGIAYAVWAQVDPDFSNIYAVQYTPGSGWGTPELIEDPIPPEMVGVFEDPRDSDAVTPRLDVNSAGNAFVVWRQEWEGWGSVWSNRLDPGTGWMDAELIDNLERTASFPIIAVDADRHAHAIWLHSVDTNVDWVRTNRFE
ncbi:MAG: Ig-like domain-containing protein [Myxococcota bacterium]